jgi:hypothetical protein
MATVMTTVTMVKMFHIMMTTIDNSDGDDVTDTCSDNINDNEDDDDHSDVHYNNFSDFPSLQVRWAIYWGQQEV